MTSCSKTEKRKVWWQYIGRRDKIKMCDIIFRRPMKIFIIPVRLICASRDSELATRMSVRVLPKTLTSGIGREPESPPRTRFSEVVRTTADPYYRCSRAQTGLWVWWWRHRRRARPVSRCRRSKRSTRQPRRSSRPRTGRTKLKSWMNFWTYKV